MYCLNLKLINEHVAIPHAVKCLSGYKLSKIDELINVQAICQSYTTMFCICVCVCVVLLTLC